LQSVQFQNQLEELYENPFDDERFKYIDEGNFNEEVDTLIEWCEDLDYDKYMEEWGVLATSTKPEVPKGLSMTMVSGGLGEL